MMRLLCLCVHRNMNVIVPPHPAPPHPSELIIKEQCLCLQDSKKDDEVAVLVRAQEHERYCPTSPRPHPTPTPPVTNHERAVPVPAVQQERWWGCCVCVCTGTWTLLSRPTPPHLTPPVTDHERAAPVSAGQQERWWGCCACVCAGTWTLLPHPTPLEHEWEMIRARKWVTFCSWVRKWVRVRILKRLGFLTSIIFIGGIFWSRPRFGTRQASKVARL